MKKATIIWACIFIGSVAISLIGWKNYLLWLSKWGDTPTLYLPQIAGYEGFSYGIPLVIGLLGIIISGVALVTRILDR